MASAAPSAAQLERIKNRRLGTSRPQVSDARPAQKPKLLPIVLHDCFTLGETPKPETCNCGRVSFVDARRLLDTGKAFWIPTFRRDGTPILNRTSLVLSAEYRQELVRRNDVYSRRNLSLSGFEAYHPSPTERVEGTLNRQIEAVRHHEIKTRRHKTRPQRISPSNGGLTVMVDGKIKPEVPWRMKNTPAE